ncbi:MAG: hypothetical protein KBC84_05615 [Proteobacteria bacterium]|nr:hypothetical protein [Pseudomonadota bacterium]
MKANVKFILCLFLFPLSFAFAEDSKISDKVIPLQIHDFPERPSPILELGDPLLKTGKISTGFVIPTGAVWQPSLIIWGDYRTALQSVDRDVEKSGDRLTEWANRFDLFGNLALTSTERFLVGFRPLDRKGKFTRYTFEALDTNKSEENKFEEEFNSEFTTFFFEGDFGEIFPNLDLQDKNGLDYYFAVGRQPISWQDGMLINDRLDSLGISKINLKPNWAVNYRSTLLWAWNEVNRKNLANDDGDSSLYGFSNEIDFKETTAEFDIVYVDAKSETGDGIYGGVGFTHRLYSINNTWRVLGSHAVGDDTDHNQKGILFFTELSTDLEGSGDYVYLDTFYAKDHFRSASRASDAGGPLGGTGVLFASLGLGRYSAALSNQADDAFGSALGYQVFFNKRRQNLILELGGRYAVEEIGQRAIASGLSLQTAIGQRNVLRFDTYVKYGKERVSLENAEDDTLGIGARVEWMLRL